MSLLRRLGAGCTNLATSLSITEKSSKAFKEHLQPLQEDRKKLTERTRLKLKNLLIKEGSKTLKSRIKNKKKPLSLSWITFLDHLLSLMRI